MKRIEDLPRNIHEAFNVAQSGRPGPVVIDIPKDIQFASGTYTEKGEIIHKSYRPKMDGDIGRIEAAVALMAKAKRPVFYTGGGIINLYSGPKAPARLGDMSVHAIMGGVASSNNWQYTQPYPLLIPAGYGLWTVSNNSVAATYCQQFT